MSDFKKINGTPWHVGTIKKAEYDDRRHRSRCAFYNSENKRCTKYVGSCRGSAHCPSYKECLSDKEKSIALASHTKNNTDSTDYECRVNAEVIHKYFGRGIIKRYDNGTVYVQFYDADKNGADNEIRKFTFPEVFKKGQMKYAADA
ncbi:MAG: hypothetical protein ACI396_06410 [Acutalibacteraceae bacterium]